uniref:Uncharacterized protein n=1 Tax=Arundo donax TaxID=35708 RepID=A0A0A9GHV0_ARUDO
MPCDLLVNACSSFSRKVFLLWTDALFNSDEIYGFSYFHEF